MGGRGERGEIETKIGLGEWKIGEESSRMTKVVGDGGRNVRAGVEGGGKRGE